MKRAKEKKGRQKREVVRLEDLAPRKPVKGGGRRLLFGERLDPPEDEPGPAPKDRSAPPD